MIRYTSSDEDSARWTGFEFRPGDIVISTRSKSGTTWMQMICALLVFRTPDLPAPLSTLSPWLDWLLVGQDEVFTRLAAQQHRRFIKTHTPLDGVPLHSDATYVVVARHPLDMAVSLFHQSRNFNRAAEESPPRSDADSLRRWIDRDVEPADALDSLPGVLWHLTDAWHRRHEPNVMLVHYADLSADLAGEMTRIAGRLGLDPPTPDLVEAAGFARMRARADELAPDPPGILKRRAAFFRAGRSGGGRSLLSDADHSRYELRAASMAPPDLLTWLHR